MLIVLNVFSFKICHYDFYGDFSKGVHLFPFRTEKLSPLAQMVLELHPGEYVVAVNYKPRSEMSGAFLFFEI